VIFLLPRKVKFCRNHISNFGIVTVSDSKFGCCLSDVLICNFARNFLVELVCNLIKLN
jgi:hypothetical protein